MGSMSQSVASSMKMLIVLALAALAAAEPEADPYYYGYGGLGYGHLGYGLGYYGYGKRSADAEPFYPYAVGGFASVSPSASVAIHGYAPAAIPAVGGLYAGAGRYVANSAGVVHVAKRSADAEADPYYYGGSGYGLGYGYGHGLYGGYYRGFYGKRSADAGPTPTTMVAMAMEAMVATTGANKDLAKHQDGILSLFRTGQL